MSDDDENVNVELPQLWQYIHPLYNDVDSEGEEEEDDEDDAAHAPNRSVPAGERPSDYVRLAKRAPRLGQLMRFLNDVEEEEELQQILLDKDPVTQQTLMQWATLNRHFMLVEYLVKRLKRGAFAFDPETTDVVVYNRWEEMRPELPTAAEVAERQQQREAEKAERAAQRARNMAGGDGDDDYEEEDEEEEAEPTPEELVYDSLEEYHDEWADRGVGIVKRIGELGVYVGARLRDGTKAGLGQTLFPNGDCYAGEYSENQREGEGVYWWSQSAIMYCGTWVHNKRHGYGRIVYPDGSRYLGFWAHDKKHGRGRYTYADGSSYDGNWENNEKHSLGTYAFTDGSSFHGSFCHNEFISGEWRLASGTVRYVGNFDKGVPVGAGMFVHRCGIKEGTFQQEGIFKAGKWAPSTLKGSTKVTPRLEVIAPQQEKKRVPIEFGPDCNGRTMEDLVRAANYQPLLEWLQKLPSKTDDAKNGVEVIALEVSSMKYHPQDNTRLVEVRVRPHLVDAFGQRLRTLGDDVLVLKEPTTRLLVLLHPSTSATTETASSSPARTTPEPMVVLERSLQFASPDQGHMQLRLPTVEVAADGSINGDFTRVAAKALRLEVSNKMYTTQLIQPLRSNPFNTNAEENVLLYSQALHPDAFATLAAKLSAVSQHPEISSYVALPLREVATCASDAMTVIAVTSVMERRAGGTLPTSTVAPQRPPTPLPPAPQPRPDLQPLYAAKAARDEAEAEEQE